MKFAIVLAALASVAQSVYGLTVNTPASVVECQPTLFTWSDGTPPYYLTLVPGGQSMSAPIKSFPTQTGTSYTWLVDLQANTLFNIALKDSTGATAYSSIITIEAGSSVSCVNTAVDESSGSTGSTAPASGTSSAATTGATSAAVSASATSGKASGTTSATSSSSTAKSSGAASSLSVSSGMGIAGVMGLLGAALF